MKFTRNKGYDKGYGWQTTYTYKNYEVINLGSSWMLTEKTGERVNQLGFFNTLKDAKKYIINNH